MSSLEEKQGKSFHFAAPVTAVGMAGGKTAFALGDGSLQLVGEDHQLEVALPIHQGACLTMKDLPLHGGWLSGGDDGALSIATPDHQLHRHQLSRKWVEQLAVATTGQFAVAAGKQLWLGNARQPTAAPVLFAQTPKTILAMAFDAKGKKLAVGTASQILIYWLGNDSPPNIIEFTGAPLSLCFSPDGRFLVTALQENALAGWRMADKAFFRMAGYSSKIHSMGWMKKGLVTSGSEMAVCWPFQAKDGPMGKRALEIGSFQGSLVQRVAPQPKHDELLATGYEDGAVQLHGLPQERSMIISRRAFSPITSLAWGGDGRRLAYGRTDGSAAITPFAL
ncbi:MAG: WD40 repeat domain-containing protein [Alphaproteobacteria bacterium]